MINLLFYLILFAFTVHTLSNLMKPQGTKITKNKNDMQQYYEVISKKDPAFRLTFH